MAEYFGFLSLEGLQGVLDLLLGLPKDAVFPGLLVAVAVGALKAWGLIKDGDAARKAVALLTVFAGGGLYITTAQEMALTAAIGFFAGLFYFIAKKVRPVFSGFAAKYNS